MLKAGQRLQEERRRKGLSLSQVSHATKIREEFLSFIEKSEYDRLPSSSYAQGFVRSYARFLELPEREVMPLFRREFASKENYDVLPESLSAKRIPGRKFRFRQIFVLGFLILFFLVGYIIFQYRYAFINPPLNIDSPKEMESISSSTITVSGNTEPSATVLVEDQAVTVDDNGNFKKIIVGFPGKMTITIKAVNRFGRQTTISRHVVIK